MSLRAQRILITGARAPVALHLARCLSAQGHRVIMADSLAFPLGRATTVKAAYVRLPSPRGNLSAYGEAVAKACVTHRIDMIVPTCEEVFHLAAAREVPGLDLPLFAPKLDQLKAVHDKFSFTRMAAGLGADAARTVLLTSRSDVDALRATSHEWVFKPVWSRFGERVLIRPTPQTLAQLAPSKADPWVAQKWLPGEELCVYAVAHHGDLRALQAYRPAYRTGGDQGAGVMAVPVQDAVIHAFVAQFVRHGHWHGQISFDFRRDAEGALHVLECNPRATTGAHFFAPSDGLAEAILDGAPTVPSRTSAQGVPLAMLVYGLPGAWRSGRAGQWWRDFLSLDNLLREPGDDPGLAFQTLSLTEITWRAVTMRQSLKAAATADIEWNGEPFS